MTPEFGHWLAGFIDAEGCFQIPRSNKTYRSCRFDLHLRIDDVPILREIRKQTGIGTVVVRAAIADRNPTAVWVVSTKRDCLQLVELLEVYPLRAKKARDFGLWREAVLLWSSMRRRLIGARGGRRFDWTQLDVLASEIKQIRKFEPDRQFKVLDIEEQINAV